MIKANYSDKQLVLDILCKSFDSNKSVNYVVKQDENRQRRIRNLMDYSYEICSMFGQVYLSDDKKACALTLFPDKKKTSLKSILLDAKMAISCVGLNRVSKVLDRDSKIKKSYPNDQILYLWFIGVNPGEQKKGIGSSLLKDIIKESAISKRPIYLETSMPENIRFYNKLGFNIYKELDFGHTLFLIKRELN
ncbi:MAG TPA: GNAT family N-acetyltransferase [Bacteroidia bacterium]|nr:GNAT family N-acetyltransferase [Bacteroidia bacterium]